MLFVTWRRYNFLICDAVLTPSVFRLWMSDLLYSGTNDAHILFDIGEVERNVKLQKSVSDVTDNILFWKKNSVLGRIWCSHLSKWAKSKNVKLRILRIQSVASFGNPNLLIVEFFRLASIKAVFFFPIGIS